MKRGAASEVKNALNSLRPRPKLKEALLGLGFTLPVILIMGALVLIPLISTFWDSFLPRESHASDDAFCRL